MATVSSMVSHISATLSGVLAPRLPGMVLKIEYLVLFSFGTKTGYLVHVRPYLENLNINSKLNSLKIGR